MPQKIRSVQEVLQVWRQAGQEKTRGEIAAYIADRQRQATEFEQRAWQLPKTLRKKGYYDECWCYEIGSALAWSLLPSMGVAARKAPW